MNEEISRFETGPRMRKAVCHGSQIYLCGQTASGTDACGIAAQTKVVLERIETLVASQGSDTSRLISVLIQMLSREVV